MTLGTVAILGPGLIGGSLALALAERGLTKRLMIYARSPRALDEIRLANVDAELTTNPSEAVAEADVVIICIPIEVMPGLVAEIRDSLKPTALVTDVGSVKSPVVRAIEPLLHGRAFWIGSHPMAGSEQAGFSAARPDLFDGAAVIITPTEHTHREAQRRAEQLWAALGANLTILSPERHDEMIAAISHIPHVAAAALVSHAVAYGKLNLAGGGFRDTTRVASGSPDLWTEILLANAHPIADQLAALAEGLRAYETALRDPDRETAKKALFDLLKSAQDGRSLLPPRPARKSSRS
jgi:prephenate dehydrogenase